MLTLFHAPLSPSSRIIWLLEELHAEYRLGIGKFPNHDGAVITETGAITLYLTDLHPNSTIGVPLRDPLRARYVTWLFYQVGLTEPLFYMKGTGVLCRDLAMSRLYESMMRNIEETLTHGPFVLGD